MPGAPPTLAELGATAIASAARREELVRTLQRMGPVSLGLCVPRRWVETQRLQVGSLVRLRVKRDGSLRVDSGAARPDPRTIRLDVSRSAPPEHLFRSLLGGYLSGASRFEVREVGGISPEVKGVVRAFVRRTIQPEVISEERSRLELRDLTGAPPVPLSRLIGRMGQLVLDLQRDAAVSWGAAPATPAPSWEQRDDEVDRQSWFIERCAVRALEEGSTAGDDEGGGLGPLGCWVVARSLERAADHGVRMGEAGARLSQAVLPRDHLHALRQFHAQALGHLSQALGVLFDDSRDRANDLLDAGEALHEVKRTLSDRLFPMRAEPEALPPVVAAALANILDAVDRTIAYAQDIAQVALDSPARPAGARTGGTEKSARPTSHATHKRNTGGK